MMSQFQSNMNRKWFLIFLLISTFSAFYASALSENYPRVITPLGGIKGSYKVSFKKQQYEAYEGIPYAKPPVEDLRFEPPTPIEPWTNDFDATKKPNRCIQFDQEMKKVTGVEDCLTLNVYVPSFKNATPFPVVVFIHGGGFQYGFNMEHRPTHIVDKNLIFISINYRLGAFGFLSTNDEVVPGNMGLKDQSVALQWISDNIQYFGGDRKRITLTGCSAGGSSVHYHYLSPMSAGLFRNGISSSGTALSPWAYTDNPMAETRLLAKLVNCTVDNSTELLRCLKEKPALEVCDASADILKSEYLNVGVIRAAFQPVAENTTKNYFINRPPKEIIKSGDIYDAPWIAGTVSAEGYFFTYDFRDNQTKLSYIDKNWETVGPYMMMFRSKMPESKYATAANAARQHYLGNKSFVVNDEIAQGLINMVGDITVRFDAENAVKLQAAASQSSVQFYYYDFMTRKTSKNYGVPHCDDCSFLLSNDNFDPSADQEITLMLERQLNFVYSVASGNDNSWRNNWPQVNPKTDYVQYIHIQGPDNITYVNSDDFAEKKFWSSL